MRTLATLSATLLAVLLCACAGPRPESAPRAETAINATCPRSGEIVAVDSLTEYRGFVVGFCNTHCRDDFAAHVDERPDDRAAFDACIAALESAPE